MDYEDKIAIPVCVVFVECTNICARGGGDYTNIFFSVRCIIPLFHPPIGVYTRYFLTLGAIMDFSRVQREKSIIARLEILSTWTITPLQFYTILISTNTAPHAPQPLGKHTTNKRHNS